MRSLEISIVITAYDKSWTATWEAATGIEPHQAVMMARSLVGMAGGAASGDWDEPQIQAVTERIAREFPDYPAPVLDSARVQKAKADEKRAIDAKIAAARAESDRLLKIESDKAAVAKAEVDRKAREDADAVAAAAKKQADADTAAADAKTDAANAAASQQRTADTQRDARAGDMRQVAQPGQQQPNAMQDAFQRAHDSDRGNV